MKKNVYKVLILGGGAGGISVAAKLSRELDDGDIAIIEPAEKHFYQPLWTVAGTGLMDKSETEKDEHDLIPNGVDWIKESVQNIDPVKQVVELSHNMSIKYDYLVVATGLQLNWEKIEGLKESLGSNGVISVYQYDQIDYAAEQIQKFQGGKAIFVMPPPPIKCAGAPQKVMYLSENIFRDHGIRHKTEVIFATAGKAMFGVPVFAAALDQIVKEKDIHPYFQHKLVKIDGEKKEATFDVADSNGKVQQQILSYDLIHWSEPRFFGHC